MRLPQLDGVRGLAILMVLIWHYVASSTVQNWAGFLMVTRTGVDLFFVLSGFLIAGILLDNRSATNLFSTFYARRFCRILPLYVLVLLAFVVGRRMIPSPWLFDNAAPVFTYGTFTQTFWMATHHTMGAGWLGATWSLALEEHFYFLLPAVIFFLSRRQAFMLLALLVLLAPVLRALSPGLHSYIHLPFRADSVMLGACLAFATRCEGFNVWVKQHVNLLILLLVPLLACGAAFSTWKWLGPLMQTWLGAMYALLLIVALAHPVLAKLLSARWLVWFGTVSYGLYLLHSPTLGLIHWFLFRQAPSIDTPPQLAATAGAAIAAGLLAAASWRWIESPVLNWGKRFRYSSREAPDSSSVGFHVGRNVG